MIYYLLGTIVTFLATLVTIDLMWSCYDTMYYLDVDKDLRRHYVFSFIFTTLLAALLWSLALFIFTQAPQ